MPPIDVADIFGSDEQFVLRWLETCEQLLQHCDTYKEQDTIERLIVPILSQLGWSVNWESVSPVTFVRGNRAGNGNRLRFDLNLYCGSANDNQLVMGIECKSVDQLFRLPSESDAADKISSNKSSLAQLYDYCDDKHGFVKDITKVVWTNGVEWFVFPHGLENNPSDGCVAALESFLKSDERDAVICNGRSYAVRIAKRRSVHIEQDIQYADASLATLKSLIGIGL